MLVEEEYLLNPKLCFTCQKEIGFKQYKRSHHYKKGEKYNLYCSYECCRTNKHIIDKLKTFSDKQNRASVELYEKDPFYCKECNSKIPYSVEKIQDFRKGKSANTFCNSSCAARYNNMNKTYGTRRSKMEEFLESKLSEAYSDLNIQFNKKDKIKSELDIFIPSMNLAFEINGIHHYKPIYGDQKFKSIKKNDRLKARKCKENNIRLHIVDISECRTFSETEGEKYLKEIKKIISNCQPNLF